MLRYIFYAVITYIIIKMLRLFFDPAVASKSNNNAGYKPNTPPKAKPEKKSSLGDYVDFEEVK